MPNLSVDEQRGTLIAEPCLNEEHLHDWIHYFCAIDVPCKPVCPGHDAPFEYLKASYFEPSKDLLVWAPRGGGKTRLGAVATLLDILHKPGIAVRILGGSLEQSLKMWEQLLPDLEHGAKDLLTGPPRGRKVGLTNGSSCAVLPQSQRAVRGLRVQKMRCDEVEMFDKPVWDAAQLVTRSLVRGGGPGVRGAIEALSTHHKPWGLMSEIINTAPERNVRVIEVLERCPQERVCATCALEDDCKGVAKKHCNGFFSIDDAITMKKRVSRDMWDAEMLCKRPNVSGSVFPNFDVDVHVVGASLLSASSSSQDRARATQGHLPPRGNPPLQLAVDFGFSNPFVCLWIESREGGIVHVVDEYVQSGRTLHEHLEQIEARPWARAMHVACDPAGSAKNDQTATSNITLLRARGYRVRMRRSLIQDGLEMIRAALRPAAGESKLFIAPACKRLIKAMQCYRYPEGGGEVPLKDGVHDHLIDALRYWFVNRAGDGAKGRRY